MDMGSAPGGSWYCEPDGIAWSEVFDPLLTGEPNNKTPRDAVTWVVRNSVLSGQLEAVVGPLDLRYRDGEQRIEANVVLDMGRAEVLAQVAGADSRPLLLSVALSDPRRSQNTTAGNVEIEFWPGQGWVLTGYSVCGSAMSGTYEPYVPLTEAERRLIDPISEDGS